MAYNAPDQTYDAPDDFDGKTFSREQYRKLQQIAAGAAAEPLVADEFRNSKLRGLATDNILANNPRSADYIALLARFRPNHSRRFLIPEAPTLGAEYSVPEAAFATAEQDIAAFAAIGCRTLLASSPSRANLGDESRDASFWATPLTVSTPQAQQAAANARAAYVRWWGRVAARFRGDKRIVAFDIINEPFHDDSLSTALYGTSQLGTDQILELQAQCIEAIRAADPSRTCIVTCGWQGAPGGFRNMRPLPYPNLVYTFHFYQPFEITHARVGGTANYAGAYPSTNVLNGESGVGVDLFAPSLATRERMYRDVQAPLAFARRYGVPMFVGEFACSRLNPGGVAPNWTEDAISVMNELGWSWCHFGFWFPPLPWASLALDSSTALIDFNNGSSSGQVSLTSATGGSTTARTPIAPVSAALENVALFETAAPLPTAGVFVEETFEGTLGRLGGAGSSAVTDAGMTRTMDSTTAPFSGTKNMRVVHSSTPGGSQQRAGCFLQDIGGGKNFPEFWFSFRVRLGAAITSGNTFTMVNVTNFGEGSGAFLNLRNNAGTNTWVLDSSQSGVFQITGLALVVNSYTKIKMAWQNSATDGRLRVWQDGKLLVDINGFPTAPDGTTRLWNVFYGLLNSTQVGQTLDFDEVRYSAGADLT